MCFLACRPLFFSSRSYWTLFPAGSSRDDMPYPASHSGPSLVHMGMAAFHKRSSRYRSAAPFGLHDPPASQRSEPVALSR